jgi:hypothetical protein
VSGTAGNTGHGSAQPVPEGVKRAPRKRAELSYAGASAERLAKTKARAKHRTPDGSTSNWAQIRTHSEARINMQRSWRQSWMQNYQLLEAYIQPRRGIFINTAMPTPNSMIRGQPINQNIVDPTGTYAARRCAAGIMSNEMSPSRQWFKLKPALADRSTAPPEAIAWFEEVEDRLHTIMARSNFYDEAAQMFEDLVIFGTGPMLIYEDVQDLIRCYTPCCGEYLLSSSSGNRVGVLSRLFVMTISAIVEMFELENCPPEVQEMWAQKGGALEVERLVAHIIEPNSPINAPGMDDSSGVVPGGFAWREACWIWGASSEWPLSLSGFHEPPFICPRWSVTSNDAYGRSVGMDVMPDILQLQVMTSRMAEAQEKMVRPPMLASIEMKNEPASVLPGKLTYVPKLGPEVGMRPAYTVNPQTREFAETILQIQMRCKEGFFADLFSLLEQTKKDMTAYEVAARNQEKLQILGPVVERLQNEGLGPAIKRVFSIANRKNLLPPLPQSLQGVPLGVEYVGILSLASKASMSAALTQFANEMSTLQQVRPEVADLWNAVELAREYADTLFIPRKIINSPDKVAAMNAARQKQQQQAQAMMAAQHAATTANTLGNTPIGGGMTAMSALTGLGSDIGSGPGAAPSGGA